MAGKPDEDNIRWNNTTLSSLAETCFFASSECGLGRDRERVGRGGVRGNETFRTFGFMSQVEPLEDTLGPYGIPEN